MPRLLYLLPLASAHMQKLNNQEAVINLYKQIRTSVLGMSDTFVSLALVLAGFFVGIKLIRLSYDTMSDEQGSGLGGVKLSQIIGPVIIIALIAGYKYVIGGLDFSVGVVVNKIADTSVLQQQVESQLQEIKIEMDKIDDAVSKDALGLLNDYDAQRKYYTGTDSTLAHNTLAPNFDAAVDMHKEFRNGVSVAGIQAVKQGKYSKYSEDEDGNNNWPAIRKLLIQYGRTMARSEEEAKGQHGILADFIGMVFHAAYLIMLGLANIFLCLLALLGPFVLAFSLFEPWKNSFITFIGKYIEVSLWMVIAKIILWITDAAGSACTSNVLNEYATMISDVMRYGADAIEGYYAFGRALTAINVIRFAGLLALFSIPDITSSIFSFGSGSAMGGATGGATGTVQTVANAPGKLLGGGAKILGHKKGLI